MKNCQGKINYSDKGSISIAFRSFMRWWCRATHCVWIKEMLETCLVYGGSASLVEMLARPATTSGRYVVPSSTR